MKPIRIRPRADSEIDACAAYIAQENRTAAWQFLESLERAFATLTAQPGIGSPRWAHLLALAGLRVWPVSGFEHHLIFYIERTDHIDVLRLLHTARDIPAALID